jgi:hypothetical protein
VAAIQEDGILSFVFVRHPFERLESAYYDKIVGPASKHLPFMTFAKDVVRQCEYSATFLELYMI